MEYVYTNHKDSKQQTWYDVISIFLNKIKYIVLLNTLKFTGALKDNSMVSKRFALKSLSDNKYWDIKGGVVMFVAHSKIGYFRLSWCSRWLYVHVLATDQISFTLSLGFIISTSYRFDYNIPADSRDNTWTIKMPWWKLNTDVFHNK